MKKILIALLTFTLTLPLMGGELSQLTLSNGMRVWLKPTANEPGEVSVRLVAEGGFSLLPEDQRGAGEMAMQVAYESGFAGVTPDQISRLFYEHSIDFLARTLPFSRYIEAAVADSTSLPTLFSLIKAYFTEQQLTLEAFRTVIRQNKEGLAVLKEDAKTRFEDAFKVINTQNYHFIKPFKKKYLDHAQFTVVQDFMDYILADPSQYICVVVGDFQVDSLIFTLKATLGQIPVRKPKKSYPTPTLPQFPPGITHKKVNYPDRTDCLSRLTFPLKKKVAESDEYSFIVARQILEKRLREALKKKFNSTMGIDVSYELPLYPTLNTPWLRLQFRTKPKQEIEVQKFVLTTLEEFRKTGPTQAEIDQVELNISRNEEFWMKDNDYWVTTVSNYALWNWNPRELQTSKKKPLPPAEVQKTLETYIPEDNYTWIYTET